MLPSPEARVATDRSTTLELNQDAQRLFHLGSKQKARGPHVAVHKGLSSQTFKQQWKHRSDCLEEPRSQPSSIVKLPKHVSTILLIYSALFPKPNKTHP